MAMAAASVGFPSQAAQLPASVTTEFAQATLLAGQGQMRFLGLRIYDARLWVTPDFQVQSFANYPFALELTYHRAFTGKAIAERSVQEIERQTSLDPAQAQRWTELLTNWLPDVKAGDSLTGVYVPQQGMRLWLGSQELGMLDNPELARYFFGIWLSPKTSEPRLREALVADLRKSNP